MKNAFLPLVLLVAFPACFKKKTAQKQEVAVVVPSSKSEDWKKVGEAKFDDDIEEFYLEDEETGNVFENNKAALPASDLDLIEIDLDDHKADVIQFDFDDTRIRQDQASKVEHNAKELKDVLKENKDAVAVVNGHSCKIAKSQTYNYMVSQERAENVKKEYVKNGCPAERFKCKGHGDSQPITQARGKAGQAPNRRVETETIIVKNEKN